MKEHKERGILIFSKISSENNLYLKFLTQKDEIITGLSFGGSTKKKKNIFQIGYFLNIVIKNKNKNFPNSISAELSKPYYYNIFNDKYKLHVENANSFFKIFEIIFQNHHLNNMNLNIPINYFKFKKVILNFLSKHEKHN